MDTYTRKAISDKLSKYDILSKNDSDFIEVCLWSNMEGFDVTINDKNVISLTYGQLEAINYLVKALDYKD